jgi:hypothetical protein
MYSSKDRICFFNTNDIVPDIIFLDHDHLSQVHTGLHCILVTFTNGLYRHVIRFFIMHDFMCYFCMLHKLFASIAFTFTSLAKPANYVWLRACTVLDTMLACNV